MEQKTRRLIDVREYPEFAAGHIKGSELVPLGGLADVSPNWKRTEPLTLICKSGRRSEQAHRELSTMGFTDLEVLLGGVDRWAASGKPLENIDRRLWSLERQVRTGAGSMVLVSLALVHFVSPWFLLWTVFVGAGLVFAGVSDVCLMAAVLGKLPWNRPARAAA